MVVCENYLLSSNLSVLRLYVTYITLKCCQGYMIRNYPLGDIIKVGYQGNIMRIVPLGDVTKTDCHGHIDIQTSFVDLCLGFAGSRSAGCPRYQLQPLEGCLPPLPVAPSLLSPPGCPIDLGLPPLLYFLQGGRLRWWWWWWWV